MNAATLDAESIRALFEHGYVVVRAFFSDDDLAVVRGDFEAVRRASPASGAELSSELRFDDPRVRRVRDRLDALAQAVASSRGQRALLPFTIGNYIQASEVSYGLHCDYGILSPSANAFKLWIPLVKPDPMLDGMTFVPMNKLREREPALARKIAGRGAAAIKNDTEVVLVGASIERSTLGASIRDLCETPEVRVGDVVVFRAQDTFHRSQEPDPASAGARRERVAWAFPIRMAGEVIHRRELFRGKAKREFLGRSSVATVLACSWQHRRESITYEELGAFEEQIRARRPGALALYYGAYAVEPLLWRS